MRTGGSIGLGGAEFSAAAADWRLAVAALEAVILNKTMSPIFVASA
jgi:hypothetical protein